MCAQYSESTLIDNEPSSVSFLNEVLAGLNRTGKRLPSKYFYDKRGSQLFDQICELDEYYLTRAELSIMNRYGAAMAEHIGKGAMLVEYGSGSSLKTQILLNHLIDAAAYVPVDISRKHLHHTCLEISRFYPDIEILPVCADFTTEFELPISRQTPSHKAVYFPGSTIGNFEQDEAIDLLSQFADLCGAGGGLLIGIDLKKDQKVLEAAYNDSDGITAEFNLNLLRRINRELDGDFSLEQFRHLAKYNPSEGRIEMFLESLCDQYVTVRGNPFAFEEGELIHTENSHKYTEEGFSQIAASVGLALQTSWSDELKRFAVLYFSVQA